MTTEERITQALKRGLTDEQLDKIMAALGENDKPWPPYGVAIEVWENGQWYQRVSAGNGRYFNDEGGDVLFDGFWRYLPANWDTAPPYAMYWIVTDRGGCAWRPGGGTEIRSYWGGGRVIHRERRPS